MCRCENIPDQGYSREKFAPHCGFVHRRYMCLSSTFRRRAVGERAEAYVALQSMIAHPHEVFLAGMNRIRSIECAPGR